MRRIVREARQTIYECGKARVMLIEINEGVVMVRPKGTRRSHPVNLVAAWERGEKAAADELRRKRKRRKPW